MSESRPKKMFNTYLSFIEFKKDLVNDSKFIEYCFHKPIKKINHINQIYEYFDEENYEKCITHHTYLTNTLISDMMSNMYRLMKIYRFYYRCGIKIDKIDNEQVLLVQKYNKYEEFVSKYLKNLEKRNVLSYIPKWTFKQSNNQLPNITISNTFVYDFFGCLIHNNKLILFVINLEDGKQNNHTKLLFQQYILHVMNINYLRININEDIEKHLNWFFKNLKKGKYYVCNKFIKPDKNNINSEILLKSLEKFYDDYYKNHLIYYKNCKKENLHDHIKNLSAMTEIELIDDSKKKIDYDIDEIPADKSCKISNQVYNHIMKNIYTPRKKIIKRSINDDKVDDIANCILKKN
ncbi:hypothetical protein [Moumouvirus maliensis]|nr:hypothetical protein [Moumouvirus maliensis]